MVINKLNLIDDIDEINLRDKLNEIIEAVNNINEVNKPLLQIDIGDMNLEDAATLCKSISDLSGCTVSICRNNDGRIVYADPSIEVIHLDGKSFTYDNIVRILRDNMSKN